MGNLEIFNQKRMGRCSDIARQIVEKWVPTRIVQYVARATQKLDGMTIDDLRTQYFAVGADADRATEVPFLDMLVIFSLAHQQMEAIANSPDKDHVRMEIAVTTDWPDEDAVRLLSRLQIETPFDEGKFLRLEEKRQSDSDEEDDPQT